MCVIAAKPTAELRITQSSQRPANTPAQAELGRGHLISLSFPPSHGRLLGASLAISFNTKTTCGRTACSPLIRSNS